MSDFGTTTTTPRDDDEPTGSVDQSLSILDQLGARREQIVTGELLDLPVPRWTDPEIWVRYRPAEHPVIRNLQTKAEKAPNKERFSTEFNSNADLLIKYCVGVFAKVDGQEYSLRPGDHKGDLTTFDHDLAANLGLHEGATARQTLKALFITDGDVVAHAQRLIDWSGYREIDADGGLEGE